MRVLFSFCILLLACENTWHRPPFDHSANTDIEDISPEGSDEADNEQFLSDEDLLSPDEWIPTLNNEAGFVEIAPRVMEDNSCHARARMWYVLQSADESPEKKPLFVFFNGGPAMPTMPLFILNTSKYTADPFFTNGNGPLPNPSSWSKLGNLLYIDSRQAGFSYELFTSGCDYIWPDYIGDAADFIETIVGIFEIHPEIEYNPVVLVGESWGGIRAATMLTMLLNYEQILYPTTRERVETHYRRIFPEYDGQTIPASATQTQFIAQILIQPYYETTISSVDDSIIANDPDLQYVKDHPEEDPERLQGERLYAGRAALLHLDTLKLMLQSNPVDIDLMYATERTDGFRATEQNTDQGDLALLYGALQPNDSFFSDKGNLIGDSPQYYLPTFLEVIKSVPTMITNARWDTSVFVPGYPDTIRKRHPDHVSEIVVNDEEWIIRYPSGEPSEVSIFVPKYHDSGHMVSASEPAKLLNDARRFMEERTMWQPTPLQQ